MIKVPLANMIESPHNATTHSSPAAIPRLRSARNDTPSSMQEQKKEESKKKEEPKKKEESKPRPAAQAPFRRCHTDTPPSKKSSSRSDRKNARSGSHDRSSPDHPNGTPPNERRSRREPRSPATRRGALGDSTTTSTTKSSERRLKAARSLSPKTEKSSTSNRNLMGDRSRSNSPTAQALKILAEDDPKGLPPKMSSTGERRPRRRERDPKVSASTGSPTSPFSSERRLRASRSTSPKNSSPKRGNARSMDNSSGRHHHRHQRSPRQTTTNKNQLVEDEMNMSWSRSGVISQRRQKAAPFRRVHTADEPLAIRRARVRESANKLRHSAGDGSSQMDVSIDEHGSSADLFHSPSAMSLGSVSNILDEGLLDGDDDDDSDSDEDRGGADFNPKRSTRKKAPKKRIDGQGIHMKQLERSLRLQDKMLEELEDGTDVETEDERGNNGRSKNRGPIQTTTDANGNTVKSYLGFSTVAAPKITAPKITAPKLVTEAAASAYQTAAMASEGAAATANYFAKGASDTATSAANVFTRAAASARIFSAAQNNNTTFGPSPRDTPSNRPAAPKKPIQGPTF
ncbi:expressed unknown protein [Seminavis robusta]|uniref:Uncharacterized protein n=1 Tax=Seminavis robusta TaxID=568900 RepID=A0A9N8DSU7_9STRA|nr:expressed unknown protein [Seminavis robusta]|eukprot:Sro346_g122690.1 n/a (571) ;mRNA; r:34065-35777